MKKVCFALFTVFSVGLMLVSCQDKYNSYSFRVNVCSQDTFLLMFPKDMKITFPNYIGENNKDTTEYVSLINSDKSYDYIQVFGDVSFCCSFGDSGYEKLDKLSMVVIRESFCREAKIMMVFEDYLNYCWPGYDEDKDKTWQKIVDLVEENHLLYDLKIIGQDENSVSVSLMNR